MILSDISLNDRAAWEKAGFELPRFDRAAVIAKTHDRPQWLHFGTGNIFRAFLADMAQRLLDANAAATGIIAAEPHDFEALETGYRPCANLGILGVLKADGSLQKRVIASVTETLAADPAGEDWQRLTEIFTAPSLQMVSFTVTEKGYAVSDAQDRLLPAAEADAAGGPAAPATLMGKIAALCYARFGAGQGKPAPIALVSMDNCSQNGARLHDGVLRISAEWERQGLVPPAFTAWLEDPQGVSFPWTMIDKITPRPDETVKAALESSGLEGMTITVTKKNTWIAPFVNAEETGYLVIEDRFPNGRPPLEKAGALFAERETVDRVERMKVGTCLNPLHTALAIYGCLLGYTSIHEEMQDPQLVALINRLGYDEGLPVAVSPGVIEPRDFLRQVLEHRFPNPFIPDTPQRIVCDTSQKLPVRLGLTLQGYLGRKDLSVDTLIALPLVFAGWCRYLMGIDDQGKPFEPSPDPLLAKVRAFLEGFSLDGPSNPQEAAEKLRPLLSDPSIFGADLYQAGLAERVAAYFTELKAGPGAVRNTLQKYFKGA